jgi:protein-tyrosine phosphatase
MGLFQKWFKGSQVQYPPASFSDLQCDMHSHFIPGIDDGARTLNDSLALITAFEQMGFRKVITTPHVMSDHYRNTSDIILRGLDSIKEEAAKRGLSVSIEAAAEYYLDYDLEQKLKQEPLLTFGKNYLLFELSFMNPPDHLFHFCFEAQMKGYRPVLAHPERYSYWHRDFEKFETLVEKGVLLQLNLNSLVGYYSPEVRKMAEKLIQAGLVSFLGSDCHHDGHLRVLEKIPGNNAFNQLIASGKLLNKSL